MNLLLYPNLGKTYGLDCTRKTIGKLLELGCTPLLEASFREEVGEIGCVYGKFNEWLARCDAILSIGGDGTIMRAAKYAVASGKPLLGVNAGRVGFLTQVERGELDHLRLLVEGRYAVCRRMLLEAELEQGGKRRRYCGLNDVVISRGDLDRVVDIDVYRQDQLIARHCADGLIFATPTGSTAYSLAAGGPIVDPSMSLLLLTAICSHSTGNRSMVLPADCEYRVRERVAGNTKGLAVAVDGRRVGRIQGERELLVRRAAAEVPFIDLGLRNLYKNINDKLSWGR